MEISVSHLPHILIVPLLKTLYAYHTTLNIVIEAFGKHSSNLAVSSYKQLQLFFSFISVLTLVLCQAVHTASDGERLLVMLEFLVTKVCSVNVSSLYHECSYRSFSLFAAQFVVFICLTFSNVP